MTIREIKQFAAQTLKTPHKDAPTSLKVGDKVTFKSDQGARFAGLKVIGFGNPTGNNGRSVYIDSDCYWFAVKVSSLKKE